MTPTQQFIEDAIAGGWSSHYASVHRNKYLEKYLLDPTFWQAVGKIRWDNKRKDRNGNGITGEWLYYWHQFVDHLANGKTIEEALTAINT